MVRFWTRVTTTTTGSPSSHNTAKTMTRLAGIPCLTTMFVLLVARLHAAIGVAGPAMSSVSTVAAQNTSPVDKLQRVHAGGPDESAGPDDRPLAEPARAPTGRGRGVLAHADARLSTGGGPGPPGSAAARRT